MNSFVTFRRTYLDRRLTQIEFTGDVLDVGGERETSRGRFRGSTKNGSWRYLNIDPASKPDLCASVYEIPLPDQSLDFVVLTEVLEHLEHPSRALEESRRVLKPQGQILISTPFLFPIHGDPDDFRRWTANGLQADLESAGFKVQELYPMGGIIAVFCDLLEAYCQSFYVQNKRPPFLARGIRKLMRALAQTHLLGLDKRLGCENLATTGYFVVAKPSQLPG